MKWKNNSAIIPCLHCLHHLNHQWAITESFSQETHPIFTQKTVNKHNKNRKNILLIKRDWQLEDSVRDTALYSTKLKVKQKIKWNKNYFIGKNDYIDKPDSSKIWDLPVWDTRDLLQLAKGGCLNNRNSNNFFLLPFDNLNNLYIINFNL